jgi:ABC-type phosphate transport system permease subunit
MRLTVRRAKIAAELRDNLELYGSQVVALVLALGVVRTAAMGGSNSYISTMILNNQQAAADWLREKRDQEDRRETLGYWSMFVLTAIAAIAAGIAAYPIVKG